MSMFRKSLTANPRAADEGVALPVATPLCADLDAGSEAKALPTMALPAKPLRTGSKGAALLALLQREDGASLDEMIERTGWQSHTVRAAMTGLRKKGHVISRRMTGNCTVWFIPSGPAA